MDRFSTAWINTDKLCDVYKTFVNKTERFCSYERLIAFTYDVLLCFEWGPFRYASK